MSAASPPTDAFDEFAYLPEQARDMQAYTQGLMDLGATVCTPRKPACLMCPWSDLCVARQEGQPERYPVKTRKLKRGAQSLWMLEARDSAGNIWLEKRPASGVWAGLHAPPMFDSRDLLLDALPSAARVTRTNEKKLT